MMKKQIAFLLTALCVAGLLGCGAAAPMMMTGSGDLSAGPEQFAMTYTVDQQMQEKTAAAQDGTPLAHYAYQLPELHAFRPDGREVTEGKTKAEQKVLETVSAFNQKFSDWAEDSDLQGIADMAQEEYDYRQEAGTQEEFVAYESELDTTIWQSEQLVSVFATYYSFTGGAHPNTVYIAWNFDLNTGSFVEPTVFAEDSQVFLSAVTEEIIRQANEPGEDGVLSAGYWENYQDVVAEWPSYAVSFDNDGMLVSFSAYDLGCYAAGPQFFHLNWEFLRPYLSEYGQMLLGLPTE